MHSTQTKTKALTSILILFLLCSIVEYIEFLYIRSDQTILADNILTKLFCIAIILLGMKVYHLKANDIGFRNTHILRNVGLGLALGILTFTISYGIEIFIVWMQGNFVGVSLYITNFGLQGATSEVSLSLLAVLICILVNIINVIAEEGLFRGLFLKLGSDAFGFKKANWIQASLFGCWHIVMVALGVYDGFITPLEAIIMSIGYVLLAGILALEWGTCVAMSGVLWIGIGEHFFNNFIGNLLHVVSTTGIDELQILRIVLSNVLSLAIVLFISKHKKKQCQREKAEP